MGADAKKDEHDAITMLVDVLRFWNVETSRSRWEGPGSGTTGLATQWDSSRNGAPYASRLVPEPETVALCLKIYR